MGRIVELESLQQGSDRSEDALTVYFLYPFFGFSGPVPIFLTGSTCVPPYLVPDGKDISMKLKIRYENVYQELEITTEDMDKLWISFDLEGEEMTEERIQEEVEKRFNRPDYNNYHKHNRHWGMPKKAWGLLINIFDWSE